MDLRKDERPLERHEERETERWSVYCVTLDALDGRIDRAHVGRTI